jgi:DNA-binding beta-propeller fold protein YncE
MCIVDTGDCRGVDAWGYVMKPRYTILLISLSGLLSITTETAEATNSSPPPRSLYAVNEAPNDRGSISVYDIDAGHHLIKTVQTVPSVDDVRGVAVSGATGRLYVAYRDLSGTGMIYCLNIYDDTIVWNRAVSPGVDRLAINPDGRLLYVPTWEGGEADRENRTNG